MTIANCRTAIRAELVTDANAFCISAGPYRAERHRVLMGGSSTYKCNPEWTAHIVLNRKRLIAAFDVVKRTMHPQAIVHAGLVQYGSRELKGLASAIPALFDDCRRIRHALDCIFIKPEPFRIEEEFRVGLIPLNADAASSVIWTRDQPDLAEVFRATIEHEGASEL